MKSICAEQAIDGCGNNRIADDEDPIRTHISRCLLCSCILWGQTERRSDLSPPGRPARIPERQAADNGHTALPVQPFRRRHTGSRYQPDQRGAFGQCIAPCRAHIAAVRSEKINRGIQLRHIAEQQRTVPEDENRPSRLPPSVGRLLHKTKCRLCSTVHGIMKAVRRRCARAAALLLRCLQDRRGLHRHECGHG